MDHSRQFAIQRVAAAGRGNADDAVAVEEPLEIRLGYSHEGGRIERPLSVTMRTPGHDEELAAGFLFTEGIVAGAGSIRKIWHRSPPVPGEDLRNVVRVDLTPETPVDFDRLQRHFYTSSSCGVCGKTSIEALHTTGPFESELAAARLTVSADVLLSLPARLESRQKVFGVTGGLHASALFDHSGEILLVREDVGRHNALDKLIGRRLLDGALPLTDTGVMVSGRASFELMQKAIMAGCVLLVAVGAPSSLAVELAREFGVTLVGFLRDGRFNIYAAPDRIGDH